MPARSSGVADWLQGFPGKVEFALDSFGELAGFAGICLSAQEVVGQSLDVFQAGCEIVGFGHGGYGR